MGTSFENGISVSFLFFWENNCQYLLLENGISVFFLVCDVNLWKMIPISSIWKRDRSGTRPKVLLHFPLRGVTRVWASMFYWFYFKKKPCKKSQKMAVGQKIFKQTSSQCWWLPSAKVVQKTNNPTVTPSTLGWSLQYLLFENCFSCIWDLSNSWGCKWISSIWKPFGGTLWVPSWNIIFYLKSVFQYSSNIFYLKNKLHYRLSSIWKMVWTIIPQSKKLKKPGFWTVFHRHPPRRRECKSTSGRVPLREVLLHFPLRGVTQVRASMFYWF